MGGVRRFKKRNKRQNAPKNETQDTRKPYEEIVRENSDFEQYYKAQKIVPDEEWETFMSYMRKDLPTSFRISECNPKEAEKLLEIVKGEFFSRLMNTEGDLNVKEPKCLPWYPNGLGWQMEITRKDIRRSEAYYRLHNFLISETACGAISRQEAVSMIPPLVLDVQPHHKVLDMCAAPGSKTAQLIEMLHGDDQKVPSGFVVANDIDNSRCYMLVHQAKRLNSPCTLITNHDSSIMPNIMISKDDTEVPLKYDRVLCDVPCTGDGTMRKNPDIWPKWNAANGNNLHGIQYRILKRGVELLAVGGRIVYSTCSLNPVENEAVIQRLLKEAEGTLEVVEVSPLLPGLKFSRGITSWLPASKDLSLYTDFSDVDEKWHTQVRPTMFPPKEEIKEHHLERCLRILPHHQDTGGFFVAVLTKTAPLPWESASAPNNSSDSLCPPPQKKMKRIKGYREDPFVFFSPTEPVWESVRDFYGIDGINPEMFMTRCSVGKKKNIYFVSEEVKEVLLKNQDSVKIINCGVKVFARCDNKSMNCSFRLAQEGLDRIENFIKPDRRIKVGTKDLIKLLQNAHPSSPLESSVLSTDIQEQIEKISQGSCILDYYEGDVKLTLVGWRGNRTLRPYINTTDAVHYLHLIGGDTSMYVVNKFKKEGDSLKTDDTVQNGEEGEGVPGS